MGQTLCAQHNCQTPRVHTYPIGNAVDSPYYCVNCIKADLQKFREFTGRFPGKSIDEEVAAAAIDPAASIPPHAVTILPEQVRRDDSDVAPDAVVVVDHL